MKILVHYNAFDERIVFEFPASLLSDGSTQSVQEDLEIIFRQCNAVNGTEWITEENRKRISRKERGLRSMCVEDVVVFTWDGERWEAYRCEGVGWKLIGSN